MLTVKKAPFHIRSLDSAIQFGRLFYAVPMAVFGMQHLTAAKIVIFAVPPWMPWPIFWVYFVGIALIAAALSLITGKKLHLSAFLMGVMLFLFVLLIHLPNLIRDPHNRFTLAVALRDLALSGAALALAGTHPENLWIHGAHKLVTLGRFFFAIPMAYFGIEHFLHPQFAPGVPLEKLMPPWMPGHTFWAYLTGTVLVASSLCLLANKKARWAAAWLGILYFVLVLYIYLPMEIVHPSIAISGELDYVADTLAMSGAALLIAGAMSAHAGSKKAK